MSDHTRSVTHHWKHMRTSDRLDFLVDAWTDMTPAERGMFIERVNAIGEKGIELTVTPIDSDGIPLIPRKTAELMLQRHQEVLEETRADLLEFAKDVQIDKDKLTRAQSSVWASLNAIFCSLAFTDSASWKSGLKSLIDEYNSDIVGAKNVVRELTQKYTAEFLNSDMRAPVAEVFQKMESALLSSASAVNEAATRAIAQDDGGNALHDIASTAAPKLDEMLAEVFASIPTEALALDRKFSSVTRYIGYHCNVLERDGITKIRQQWQTIYQRLKSRESAYKRGRDDDALDALEYFRQVRPWDMLAKSDELRRFEKQISEMKNDMKSYCYPFRIEHPMRRTKERTKDSLEGVMLYLSSEKRG